MAKKSNNTVHPSNSKRLSNVGKETHSETFINELHSPEGCFIDQSPVKQTNDDVSQLHQKDDVISRAICIKKG